MLQAILFSVSLLVLAAKAQYKPTWESLDSRPLPGWYDEAKIGIFLHWGVFSVPSFGSGAPSEWFWDKWHTSAAKSPYRNFMQKNYKPGFTYADFGPQFTAELYNPDQWADLFMNAGAKYVVLTSKHHEGFCNWATNVSFSWNSMDVGPHRDLVGDLMKSIRSRTDIHFGLYHSLFEWFNQLYIMDSKAGHKTQLFPKYKTIPELHELVNKYQPEVIWSDGDWGASDDYWTSKEFLAWLYNESPVKDTVVVNDRWGKGIKCKHGDYYTCQDRYNPGVLQPHKWENAMTIDKGSWGYRRNVDVSSYLTLGELITTLAETISCGGNILINVGPTHDGRILPIFEERLLQMGSWLKVNGEGIYGSKPWTHQNDTVNSNIWYTMKKSKTSESGQSVYAFMLKWPINNKLILGAPVTATNTRIQLLGLEGSLKYTITGKLVEIELPFVPPSKMPSDVAWMLKFDNLKNSWTKFDKY